MAKEVTLNSEQWFNLYRAYGLKLVDEQVAILSAIFAKSSNQVSHSAESETDYNILKLACEEEKKK